MIRDAVAGDAGVLARVLGDWVRDTEWMPKLHSREEDLGFLQGLIAACRVRILGEGAGFMAVEGGVVRALYLEPAARGLGLGKALLDEAKGRAGRLELYTFEANAGARRFYAREGFREVRFGAENEEGLPDVFLVWQRGS